MTPVADLIAMGYWLVPWCRNPRKPMVTDWLTKKPNAAGFLAAYGDSIDWAIVPIDAVVLDIEMKNGLDGFADLAELTGLGNVCDIVATTKTKSGGYHLWFQQPDGERLEGGFHIRPGIEAKAINGSVHVPPSVGYKSLLGLVAPQDLPEMPSVLLDAWRKAASVRGQSKQSYKTEIYTNGERRQRLCSMAGKLRSCGLTEPELIACLLSVRDQRCEDPETFSDDEIIGIARDYAKRPERTEQDRSWLPKQATD